MDLEQKELLNDLGFDANPSVASRADNVAAGGEKEYVLTIAEDSVMLLSINTTSEVE